MSKGGGTSVPSVKIPPQMTQAMQSEADIAQKQQQLAQEQLDFGKQMFAYGRQRTGAYTDPVLNEFLKTLGVGGGRGSGPAQFTNVLSSNLMQLPVWATQQQATAAKKNIMQNVPPGPQQETLLANVDNQRMQNLGTQAYGRVDQMLNALLNQGGSVWQGAQAAQAGFGQAAGSLAGAAGSYGQEAGIAGQVANIQQQNQQLQLMAQQQGNQMLGGIFQSIGTLGGYALGNFAGSPAGSAAIAGLF